MIKKVEMKTVDSDQAGQRIDNFLLSRLKNVPRSRIYRALRNGEVRVNKGRVKVDYRLQLNDCVRIPPLSCTESSMVKPQKLSQDFTSWIVYENDYLLVVNKPAGLPVHGGSGLNGGLIERLRLSKPNARFLELVHRIDKETSGCLLIAKKRQSLIEWHRLLTERKVHKQYLALVKGRWQGGERRIEAPLLKSEMRGGERIVTVSDEGKPAVTLLQPLQYFKEATLLAVRPITGRTHQIRVHAAYCGHPIVGDPKYGDKDFNHQLRAKRLFLHAAGISARVDDSLYALGICVPLDKEFNVFLSSLK